MRIARLGVIDQVFIFIPRSPLQIGTSRDKPGAWMGIGHNTDIGCHRAETWRLIKKEVVLVQVDSDRANLRRLIGSIDQVSKRLITGTTGFIVENIALRIQRFAEIARIEVRVVVDLILGDVGTVEDFSRA